MSRLRDAAAHLWALHNYRRDERAYRMVLTAVEGGTTGREIATLWAIHDRVDAPATRHEQVSIPLPRAAQEAKGATVAGRAVSTPDRSARTAILGTQIGQRAGFPVVLDDLIAWPDRTELHLRVKSSERVVVGVESSHLDAGRLPLRAVQTLETSRLLVDDQILLCRGITRGFVSNFGHLITEVFDPVPADCSRLVLEMADYQNSESSSRAVIELPT